MEILVYKDLILEYIRNNESEAKNLFKKILDNENSILLYSKKFIEFLENEIDKTPKSRELVRFQSFVDRLQKVNSDKRPNKPSSDTSNHFNDEFIHLFANTPSNVVLALSLNDPSPAIKQAIPKIAVFSEQKKRNYHWLVVNLAICSPFTLSVDEANFKYNHEIDTFFDDLFSIPKRIESVTIFDDYLDSVSDKKYNNIKNSNICYCMRLQNHPDNKTTIDAALKKLSENFPNSQLRRNGHGSHTRRIIFEGFVVNPDIAINQAKVPTNKIWSIHIRFGEELAKTMLAIRDKEYNTEYEAKP